LRDFRHRWEDNITISVRIIDYHGDNIKEEEMGGHVACVRKMRNARKILVGKPEGKEPFGRPWRSWGNNNRMNVRELRWEVVDWIHVVRDIMKLRVT